MSRPDTMVFAAIDIGSNAIRLLITRYTFNGKTQSKKLEYIRFPLRLGQDVFQTGEVTYRNERKFVSLLQAFKTLIDLYEVDDYFGCATAALREAKNGPRILERAYENSGLYINTINGIEESQLISQALRPLLNEENDYVNVDVGGGSTEVSFFEGAEQVISESFRLGSVRNMQGKEDPAEWDRMRNWIQQNCQSHKPLYGIGTGGNINKFLDFMPKKSKRGYEMEDLQKIDALLNSHSLEERIKKLALRKDRADVIPFASQIYLKAFEWAAVKSVFIPAVGLKDGIIEMLRSRNTE